MAFLPPEPRTILWNEVLSSSSSAVFCASVASLSCGSLTLSKRTFCEVLRKVAVICFQVESKRARTPSWSCDIAEIHCQESW